MQGIASYLYSKNGAEDCHFTKPIIRNEKMLVEWEHKTRQKTIRKYARLRCTSNIERLGLSYLTSQLGPANINKLMKSKEYSFFIEELKLFLGNNNCDEKLFQSTIGAKNKILLGMGVSLSKAKENETSFKCGIIITTGFYMGFPFYKRITLDSQIGNREEYLKVYLHECGHQLFDLDRKFSKTIKLGLSWIGWMKTTESWWIVEEKSCNLIAEELLELHKSEIQSDTKYKESLGVSNWVYFPLASDYKERYARLFNNPAFMLGQLKNARIDIRYSTKDEIATVFRKKIKEVGIKTYIHLINPYITLKEVLVVLRSSHLEAGVKY